MTKTKRSTAKHSAKPGEPAKKPSKARGVIPLPETDVVGQKIVSESPLHDIDLDEIEPDPNQGRWILPPEIRGRFHAHEIDAGEALALWRKVVERLVKQSAKAAEIPEARKLGEIEALAHSISAGGQVNPITVCRAGDVWRIETGERRFWAHQWLVAVEHDEEARKIPAIVRPQLDPFRQAVENLHAAPLNAIGTARTIGRLILELSENTDRGRYSEGLLDWAASRQIAAARGPPKGLVKIRRAMGKSADYVDNHRRLLLLPDESLELADRNDLSERQLRPVTKLKDAETQNRVVRLAVELHLPFNEIEWLCQQPDIARAERELRARLAVKAEAKKAPPRAQHGPEKVLFQRVTGLLRLTESVAKGGKPPAQALAEEYLAERGDRAESELRELVSILDDTLAAIEKSHTRPSEAQTENTDRGRQFPGEGEAEARASETSPPSA